MRFAIIMKVQFAPEESSLF